MSDSTLSTSANTLLLAAPEFNQAIVSGKVFGTVKFFDDRRSPRVVFTLAQRNKKRFFYIKVTEASVIAVARGLAKDTEVMIIGEVFQMEESGIGVLAKTIMIFLSPSAVDKDREP